MTRTSSSSSSSLRNSSFVARSLCAAAVLVAGVSGCGQPAPQTWNLDDPGTRLGNAGSDVSGALEYALASASLITETNLQGPGGVAAAQASVTWLMGPCVVTKALAGTARGMELDFAGDGCSVPSTSLQFQGKIIGQISDPATGAMTVQLVGLKIAALTLDGTITLTPTTTAQSFRFAIQGLKHTDATGSALLDATGITGLSTDHVDFSGSGTLTRGKDSYVFEAKSVARSFADGCYPDHGTIVITAVSDTGPTNTPASASLLYDNAPGGLGTDQSGEVNFNYQGHTLAYAMPGRLCSRM